MKIYCVGRSLAFSAILMITTLVVGCGSDSPPSGSVPIGDGSSSGGTLPPEPQDPSVALEMQMEAYLNGIEQNIDLSTSSLQGALNVGDKASASAFAMSNCTTLPIARAGLQERIMKGQLSATNPRLIRIGDKIKYLSDLSGCSN